MIFPTLKDGDVGEKAGHQQGSDQLGIVCMGRMLANDIPEPLLAARCTRSLVQEASIQKHLKHVSLSDESSLPPFALLEANRADKSKSSTKSSGIKLRAWLGLTSF
jgi:hypothetical protein